jgi:hypothetical protein
MDSDRRKRLEQRLRDGRVGYFHKNIDVLIEKKVGSCRQASQRYEKAACLLRRLYALGLPIFALCASEIAPSQLGSIKDCEIEGFIEGLKELDIPETFRKGAKQHFATRKEELLSAGMIWNIPFSQKRMLSPGSQVSASTTTPAFVTRLYAFFKDYGSLTSHMTIARLPSSFLHS